MNHQKKTNIIIGRSCRRSVLSKNHSERRVSRNWSAAMVWRPLAF